VTWFEALDTTLDEVWQELLRGQGDANAPARQPTLATHGLTGFPEARTVVMRSATRKSAELEIHTDRATTKVSELKTRPRAALHIWVPQRNLQIRIRAEIEIADRDRTDKDWRKVPTASRENYGVNPAPGTPITAPNQIERSADPERFAILICRIIEIDTVCLTGPLHHRALFRRADDWKGQWLAP